MLFQGSVRRVDLRWALRTPSPFEGGGEEGALYWHEAWEPALLACQTRRFGSGGGGNRIHEGCAMTNRLRLAQGLPSGPLSPLHTSVFKAQVSGLYDSSLCRMPHALCMHA